MTGMTMESKRSICRIQVGKEHPDPFISIYRAPEPSIRSAQGVLVQCTGLVPAQFIRHIVVTIG